MPPLAPHPDDAAFLEELTEVAFEVARRLGLPLRTVEHKRRPHPGGRTGLCYWQEGRVSLVLRWRDGSDWWPHPWDPVDVWCTLAHELAHLSEPNHGQRFKEWASRCRDAVADVLAARNRWPLAVATLRTRNQMEKGAMKKKDVQIGEVYAVKVSGQIAPVVIDEVHPAGGWVGTNEETHRQVRIKSAQRLRCLWDDYLARGEKALSKEKPDATGRDTGARGEKKPDREPKAKKPKNRATRASTGGDGATMSGLDAAAEILEEAGEPLDCKTIVERAFEKGYWQSEGKTPAATIYSAILREIQKKGDAARFRKAGRGLFVLVE